MDTAGNASDASPLSPPSIAIRRHEHDAQTSVVTLTGDIDLSSAPGLKWALTDVFGASCSHVVVDLSRVTFIDSTALGVLVGVQMRLKPGMRLSIVGANAKVLKIFELTGLVGTLELFSTLEDAIAHPGTGASTVG